MTAQAKALVAFNLIEIEGVAASFTPRRNLGGTFAYASS
jgi:hypothetical protein